MNERIAVEIIKEYVKGHLKDDEKFEFQHLVKNKNLSYFDFYMPYGVQELGIQGPAAIEFKERLVSDTFMRLSIAYDSAQLSELIFIILDEKNYESLKLAKSRFHASRLKGRVIKVYSLISFLTEHDSADNAEALIQKWLLLYGEYQNKSSLLDEIRKRIHDNSYTLFFGAGVSCSAGLPSWDKLMKGVMRKVIKKSGISLKVSDYAAINKYCYCSNSPLIMAQYLSENLSKGELSSFVRKEIYKKCPNTFYLLDALVELVNSKKPESVITYNYDDLFELRAEPHGIHCHSIADDNRVEGDELPVYHVHGVLPQNSIPNKDEMIVLDEKSYHTENKDAFLWSNIEQMHALRRSTCIFVGLSMTDPNLRRLLDISHRNFGDESAYHYAFLKKEELRSGDVNKNRDNQAIIEKMLLELGVTTFWYNEHGELPNLIKALI